MKSPQSETLPRKISQNLTKLKKIHIVAISASIHNANLISFILICFLQIFQSLQFGRRFLHFLQMFHKYYKLRKINNKINLNNAPASFAGGQ